MKLQTIMNALEHYMISADCSERDREDAITALKSCQSVRERYESSDTWEDRIHVVTPDNLFTLLNYSTYNTYGRIAHSYKGEKVPFSSYAFACRCDLILDEMSDEQLMLGFDILSDIWDVNEEQGFNLPNGEFRKDEHEVMASALPWLEAYLLTNNGYLDGKEEQVQKVINDVKKLIAYNK